MSNKWNLTLLLPLAFLGLYISFKHFVPTSFAAAKIITKVSKEHSFLPMEEFADYDTDGILTCFDKVKVREHVDIENEICVTQARVARAKSDLQCPTMVEARVEMSVLRDSERKLINLYDEHPQEACRYQNESAELDQRKICENSLEKAVTKIELTYGDLACDQKL